MTFVISYDRVFKCLKAVFIFNFFLEVNSGGTCS